MSLVLNNRALDVTQSCGPDLMSPRLLKEGSHILSKPYSFLFNSYLQQGYFRLPGNFPILRRFIKRMTDLHLLCHSAKVMESIKHYTIILMSISFSLPFSLDLSKGIRRHFSYFIHIIASVKRWIMVGKCGWYFAIYM